MDLIVKRKGCGKSFDRSPVNCYNGAPQEEIHATIDRVEVAADGFRHVKKAKRCMLLFFLIIGLCIVGCAVRRHMRGQPGWWRRCGGRKGLWNSRHGKGFQPLTPPQEVGPDGQASAPQPPKFAPDFPHGFQKPKEWGRHGGRHGGWGHHGQGPRHHGRTLAPKPAVDSPLSPPEPADLPTPQPAPQAEQAPQVETLETPAAEFPAATETVPAAEPSAETAQGPVAGETVPGSVGGSEPVDLPMPAPVPMPPVQIPLPIPPVMAGNLDAAQREAMIRAFRRAQFWKLRLMKMRRRRHHRRVFRFWAFIIGFPILAIIAVKCHRRKVFKRVKSLLEIENRSFRAKYGCEWIINSRMTELTLRPTFKPQMHQEVQLTAYPVQQLQRMIYHPQPHPHPQPQPQPQPQSQPHPQLASQGPVHSSPIFTERHEAVQQPQLPLRRGYQRVSLDDSVIGYN